MPGFPFGPTRPNTRADLPLTASVLMPAVRRSLAVRGSGAAVALVIGRKGIVTAMATPDARICRRVRRVGCPLSVIGFPLSPVPSAPSGRRPSRRGTRTGPPPPAGVHVACPDSRVSASAPPAFQRLIVSSTLTAFDLTEQKDQPLRHGRVRENRIAQHRKGHPPDHRGLDGGHQFARRDTKRGESQDLVAPRDRKST